MKHTRALLTALLLAPLASLHAAEPITIDLTKRTWQGIPGLECTAKGRVFASWFTGGPKEPSPDNTVVLSRSDDGGKTFSPPEAMALSQSDGTRCFDPTLWIDPKGRLWYIFNRGNKDTAKHDVWARICDDPDASPPVWGAEFRVGYDVPFAFRMNKVTVLSTGEWLMPVTLAEKPVLAWSTGYNDQQIPTLHGVGISTDEGRTWKLHGAVKSRPWALENMIIELKDGRLWMLIRTSSGMLWQSHSTDKGRTWSEGIASTIKSPGSRFFIRRLASGNLLLVNHHNFKGRSHLTAQLSTDDGATWNDGLLLDERSGVSYPDGVQDKDGVIWITYDRDRNGAGEILLAKFREEDVATGKDVSRVVSLKQVISKLDKPTLLPPGWDPKRAGDEVLSKMIKVSAPQVKGAHDADLVLVGERAFIVEHDNDVKPGHGAGNAQYCVLTVVNVKTMSVERVVPMAKSAQAFANETLPAGACFVPRIIQMNDTILRCFFVCEDQSGKRQSQTWYRDFDIASLTFAPDIHRVKLKTSDGTFDMQSQYFYADAAKQGFKQPAKAFGLYLLDAFKVIDGKTYLAINNFPGAQNALAMLNDARDTIEVIGHYNEPAERRLTESSVNRLPDGTWMAICRTESGDRNYVFTTSKDGKTWTQGESRPFVSKGSNSKPTFDKFNGLYYLGWQEATRITDGHGVGRYIFNIEVSRDGVNWERKYRFESPNAFQYPTFRQHDGSIWFTVTQGTGGSTDRIMFGKLESSKPAHQLQPNNTTNDNSTAPPPSWEQIRRVPMSGGLRAFWNVAGGDNATNYREAAAHGFEMVDLLSTYSDYPGRQKENIRKTLDTNKTNPWQKPEFFERIVKRNIEKRGNQNAIFVHDIEFSFEENIDKVWADPVLRAESKATTREQFADAYLREWATWFTLPCQWAKERFPGTPIGIYGPQPFRRDYFGISGKSAQQIDGTHHSDAELWQHIDPFVDYYIASIYVFYDKPDSIYYMAANVEENIERTRRYGSKPLYAYEWLRYHSSNKKLADQEVAPWLAEAMAVLPYFCGARGVALWGSEPKRQGQYYHTLPVFMNSLGRVSDLSAKIAAAKLMPDEPAHVLWKAKRPLIRRMRVSADEWIILAVNHWQAEDAISTVEVPLEKGHITVELRGRHSEIFHCLGESVKRL